MKDKALPSEALVESLIIEAEYQAARETLTRLARSRDAALYGLWCVCKSPSYVASQLPATVRRKTVEAAVLKLAPPVDFEVLELFPVS